MHFVGMASMSLKTLSGVEISIKFQNMPTVVSLTIALLFAFLGLYVTSKDVVFCKSKTEIVDLFVKNAAELSQKQIRKLSAWYIFSTISTHSFHHLAGGGLLLGSGFCAMHYLGMWAISFDGVIIWDKGIIAASVLIALITSTVVMWILFRLLSLYPKMETLRIGSAFIMAVALWGTHSVGMRAASYDYRPTMSQPNSITIWGAMSKSAAFYSALIMSVLFTYFVLIAKLADLRSRYHATTDQLDKAERLLYKMNDNCYSTAIRHYIDRKKANTNGESYQSKISSVNLIGHADDPTNRVTLVELDRALFVPGEIKSVETSLHRSYSEQRMGPPHEHPSLAGALHEYRVPAVQKKSPPVLLSTAGNNHVFFGSDNKIACEPPPHGIAEMV